MIDSLHLISMDIFSCMLCCCCCVVVGFVGGGGVGGGENQISVLFYF